MTFGILLGLLPFILMYFWGFGLWASGRNIMSFSFLEFCSTMVFCVLTVTFAIVGGLYFIIEVLMNVGPCVLFCS